MINSQPNILVFSSNDAEEYADCVRSYGFTSVQTAETLEEAERVLPGTEVILGWKFPTQLLNQPCSSSIRWFQSMGAGVNDLLADQSIPNNIIITRIVGQFGAYISEYVFTYLLYLLKDVNRMRQAAVDRQWDNFMTDTLEDKIIGIAGLGSIGSEIIRKSRAFDMKVYGLSYSGKNAHWVDRHFHPNEWKVFVKDLDYLVLTLPLTNDTYHIITRDILLSLKPKACLVNVGRGALINEDDLISVMESGHLSSAVLDVFEIEPLPKEHAFYRLPNVYVTSHLSGPSTAEGVGKFFSENIKRFINGQPLLGLVDRALGY